jgi:hypothetical protein
MSQNVPPEKDTVPATMSKNVYLSPWLRNAFHKIAELTLEGDPR